MVKRNLTYYEKQHRIVIKNKLLKAKLFTYINKDKDLIQIKCCKGACVMESFKHKFIHSYTT